MAIHVTPIPKLTEFGTPGLTLTTANAAGAASTTIRTDASILAYDATVPASISTANATGSAAVSARRDHVHQGVVLSQIVVASRTAAAGSGDQAITGAGFTPTRVIGISYDNDDLIAGWGLIDDDGDEYVIYTRSASAGYTYNPHFINIGPNGSNTMHAVWKSFDADGLTLTWTKTGSPPTADFALLLMR